MCSHFDDLLNCSLNFTYSFIIIFPSPSGKLTPKKCSVGGMASLQLSKAETITLVRCLNCQGTACICIISLKYQQFIHSYLVLKKDLLLMSPFLFSYVPCHTLPYLLSFLTWSWYPPLCDAISILSGLSFCFFFACTPNMEILGYYSLLTACSISLNIFRAFGILALSLQGLSLVQVQVKFKSLNTFQVALQRRFIS